MLIFCVHAAMAEHTAINKLITFAPKVSAPNQFSSVSETFFSVPYA